MFKPLLSLAALAQAAVVGAVTVNVASSTGNATSPMQYGIMYEDINNSGDGGVYAELIQNRAFQGDTIFPTTMDYWYPLGGAHLALKNLSSPLSDALPTSLQVKGGDEDTIGFWNEGFWGFPIVASWEYNGSFYINGNFDGAINVALVSNTTGATLVEASVDVTSTGKAWTQFLYTFQPTLDGPDSNNTLQFTMPASAVSGSLNFNLLSLFPPTYNSRPNGNRVDLMEAMAGLKPSFFRLPGGNNLEGNQPPYWWDWKTTLGPLEGRPGYPGTWGYENTDGLGLIEYMLWAQDLGMEPILGVWSGLWLNGTHVPKSELQPYIDDALDEIEFLMGDISTPWGAKRAALGYPEPWPIRIVEVGNEDSLSDGGPSYRKYRFDMFYNAIRAVYPDMMILASFYDVSGATPPFDASGDFHEYAVPLQMSSQFAYFDNYTNDHPLFLGEYAVIEYDIPGFSSPQWTPHALRAYFPFWYGSVSEAIYLLSAEQNADKIIGAAYAPGFMNLNKWQWIPDLIAYDADPAHTILSTSYYMIQLLSGTRITENLATTGSKFDPAYWVAGRSDMTGSHILKAAVYNSSTEVPFYVTFDGVSAGSSASLAFLTAPKNSSNTIGNNVVQTSTSTITANKHGCFHFKLPEYSVGVLEVDAASSGYGTPESRIGWLGWKDWIPGNGYSGNWNDWGQGWPNL